jgi:hypothetical protein
MTDVSKESEVSHQTMPSLSEISVGGEATASMRC